MRYNDTSTRQGIIQEIEGLLAMSDGEISGDTSKLKNFTRRVNRRYSEIDHIIFSAHGTWEYDDSNKTTLPIATADIVNEQQDYELPDEALQVDRIEIKDTNGEWAKLIPMDKSMVRDALTEFYKTAGIPKYYDLAGRSIILYPKPDTSRCGVSGALKAYFTRSSTAFDYTDTSTEPGFAKPFHYLLAVGAALDYAISYEEWNKANQLRAEWNKGIEALKSFYGLRHREMRPRIIPYEQSSI